MASFDWGAAAAGAQQALEDLIAQRLLQEQSRREAERLAMEQERQAQATSQWERTFSRDDQRYNDPLAVRGRTADVEGKEASTAQTRVSTEGAKADNSDKAVLRARRDEARAGLENNPILKAVLQAGEAGITTAATDVLDPKGDYAQNKALARIKAQGDQNVRSAAAAASSRPVRTVTIKTVDEDGKPVTRVVPINEAVDETFVTPPPAEQQNRTAAAGRASTVLSSIDELSQRINQQAGVVAAMAGGPRRAAAQANLDDDVAEYQALVSGFTPMLARAVGHTGVLTEQDVVSVKQMLPQVGDSKSVRDRKMARIKTIWQGMNPQGGESEPAEASGASVPAVGTERMINGVPAVWDGKGWKRK